MSELNKRYTLRGSACFKEDKNAEKLSENVFIIIRFGSFYRPLLGG